MVFDKEEELNLCMREVCEMNRRDMWKFADMKEVMEETEDVFSFFVDDLTEDLYYK